MPNSEFVKENPLVEQKEHVPQDVFVEEMKDLQRVDWPSIWKGPPLPTREREFREWCDRYGWKNQTHERNLIVTTHRGNELSFNSSGLWFPVKSVGFLLWMADTERPDEEQEIMSQAERVWGEFVQRTSFVYGPPSWAGRGDSQDFPNPPREDIWRKPRWASGNPYRMAYWNPYDVQNEAPYIVLEQSHSLDTWETGRGAGATIDITFEPPYKVSLPHPPDLRNFFG